jgi:mannobiose 2-epimerase
MYAAATVYKATGDPAALELAKKAFLWFDGQSHDAKSGGYLEVAAVNADAPPGEAAQNPIGAKADEKSMNSSIHILEALTALYGVWPDPVVKDRLTEMFTLTRDRIYADPGHLRLYFSLDWTPQETEDSYGHDVETAFLLVEAATALGMPDEPRTWTVARNLVDHSLQVGTDPQTGALYDAGPVTADAAGKWPYKKEKIWWVQAEWLNALLLLHEKYGGQTPVYWDAFNREWEWITRHQVDQVHGGWLKTVNADGTNPHDVKGDGWTECYHQGRAMMEVSTRLRALAAGK